MYLRTWPALSKNVNCSGMTSDVPRFASNETLADAPVLNLTSKDFFGVATVGDTTKSIVVEPAGIFFAMLSMSSLFIKKCRIDVSSMEYGSSMSILPIVGTPLTLPSYAVVSANSLNSFGTRISWCTKICCPSILFASQLKGIENEIAFLVESNLKFSTLS